MLHAQRWGAAGAVLVGVLLSLSPVRAHGAADQAPAAVPVEPGAWKHHHVTFVYYGLTALYTCDGLEDKVAQILRFLGARKDVQVQAPAVRGDRSPRATRPS